MDPRPIDPELLLAHGPWLRSLAQSLVRDSATAEDLVQDTWLAALRSPPAHSGALRSWLAQVIRNFARQRHRSNWRRADRERHASSGSGVGGSEDLVEHMELHRTMVDAVLALREPYRETIILRYFRELGPSDIASSLSIPIKTVKSRLHRALQDLRRSLDDQYGTRERWSGLALPITGLGSAGLAVSKGTASTFSAMEVIGGLTMAWKISLALALGAVLLWMNWPNPESGDLHSTAAEATNPDLSDERQRPTGESSERASGVAPLPTRSEPLRQGKIVDAETGEPIHGARIAWIGMWPDDPIAWTFDRGNAPTIEPKSPTDLLIGEVELQAPFIESPAVERLHEVESDADGRFELTPRPTGARFLRVIHPAYRYLWTRAHDPRDGDELELRLHPKLRVQIQLVDEDGRAATCPPQITYVYAYVKLDAGTESVTAMRRLPVDSTGRIDVEIPEVAAVHLSIAAPKYQITSKDLTPPFHDQVRLELLHQDFIGAVVIDPAGNPIANVEAVVFESAAADADRVGTITQCGDDGRFAYNVESSSFTVSFSAPGFAGRELSDFELNRDDRRVVLSPAQFGSIRGHVYESDGRPADSILIQLHDRSGTSAERHTFTTDGSGRFQFEPVTPSTYHAVLWRLGADGSRTRAVGVEGTPIRVGPSEAVVATLSFPRSSGSIVGTVETPELGAAPDQFVFLKRSRRSTEPETISLTITDDQGRFEFDHVAPGRYLVSIGSGGSTSRFVEVVEHESTEIVFGRDSRRMAIQLSRDGAPVTNAGLYIGRLEDGDITDLRQGRTNASGLTSRLIYPMGEYLFRAEDPGKRTFFGSFAILEGEEESVTKIEWPTNTVTIHAVGKGTVSIDLIARHGQPLEAILPLQLRRVASGVLESGVHTTRGVAPGEYTITVTVDGQPRTRRVRIDEGDLSLSVDSTWKSE